MVILRGFQAAHVIYPLKPNKILSKTTLDPSWKGIVQKNIPILYIELNNHSVW